MSISHWSFSIKNVAIPYRKPTTANRYLFGKMINATPNIPRLFKWV